MEESDFEIRKKLIHEIKTSGAFDFEKPFVNFDKIWANPNTNKVICELISSYIEINFPIREISRIIVFDTVAYPFGIIPLASLISENLSIPLGILKEGDNPLTGEDRYYGDSSHNDTLLLYDVTRYGINAVKLIYSLYKQDILPRWFLTVVDFDQNALEYLSEQTRKFLSTPCEFSRIISLGNLNS